MLVVLRRACCCAGTSFFGRPNGVWCEKSGDYVVGEVAYQVVGSVGLVA